MLEAPCLLLGLAPTLETVERVIAKVEAEATPALATIQYGNAPAFSRDGVAP
jgi:hypothetical protein